MDYTNTPPQFIFPVLKSAEILQCMTELEIELTKAELSEPQRHKDKLKKVWLQLLDTCCGVSESDLEPTKPMLDKAASMPYPGLHEDTTDIKFFFRLRKCMRACGIYDFSWKDLHVPTSKRLRWQLSAIINLAKFREDQLMVYAELNEPRADFLMSLDEVNKENEQLKEQLEETQAKAEEDYEAMEQVSRECEKLRQEIANSNKLQASKREEASQLKRKANDLKDELATATWTLEEVEAEEERLRSQVISSPDRRQKELIDKRKILDREREESGEIEKELQNNKTRCLHVEQAIKAMRNEVVAVGEIKEEASKYSQLAEKLESATHELDATNRKVAGVNENIVLCERDLNRSEEKLFNMQKQSKAKMDAAQESLEAAKARLQSVEKDRRDGMERIQAGEAKVREIEIEMENERLQAQDDCEAMIAEFRDTEDLVIELMNKRMVAIGVKQS